MRTQASWNRMLKFRSISALSLRLRFSPMRTELLKIKPQLLRGPLSSRECEAIRSLSSLCEPICCSQLMVDARTVYGPLPVYWYRRPTPFTRIHTGYMGRKRRHFMRDPIGAGYNNTAGSAARSTVWHGVRAAHLLMSLGRSVGRRLACNSVGAVRRDEPDNHPRSSALGKP